MKGGAMPNALWCFGLVVGFLSASSAAAEETVWLATALEADSLEFAELTLIQLEKKLWQQSYLSSQSNRTSSKIKQNATIATDLLQQAKKLWPLSHLSTSSSSTQDEMQQHAILTAKSESTAVEEKVPISIVVYILLLIMLISLFFERLVEGITHHLKEMGRRGESMRVLMDKVSHEIMTLGFISLLLYLAVRSSLVETIAGGLLPSAEHNEALTETFEDIHVFIFVLMVTKILVCGCLMFVMYREGHKWHRWEQTTATTDNVAKGADATLSMKTMLQNAGYLDSNGKGLKTIQLDKNPWTRILHRGGIIELLQWRAIRYEFMFPSPDSGYTILPDVCFFQFSAYLSEKLGKQLAEIVELDLVTWCFMCAVACVVPVLLNMTVTYWYPMLAAAASWLIVFLTYLVGVGCYTFYIKATPEVPENPEEVLAVFAGTNTQALQFRQEPEDVGRGVQPRRISRARSSQLAGRLKSGKDLQSYGLAKLERMDQLLRLLIFAESLVIVAYFLLLFQARDWRLFQSASFLLAWGGTVLNLFILVPDISTKLTLLGNIRGFTDEKCCKSIILETKASKLVHSLKMLGLAKLEQRLVRLRGEDGKFSPSDFKHFVSKYDSLPEKTRRDLAYAFDTSSADTGAITKDQLQPMLSMLIDLDAHSCKICTGKVWAMVDRDKSGRIEWNEFKVLMAVVLQADSEDEVRRDMENMFNRFDADGSGTISLIEMQAFFVSLGVMLDDADMSNLVFQVLKTFKVELTCEEFVHFMMGLEKWVEDQGLSVSK